MIASKSEIFGTVQVDGCAVQVCGPSTGHAVKAIAFCNSPESAQLLAAGIVALDLLDPAANWLLAGVSAARPHMESGCEANAEAYRIQVERIKTIIKGGL